MFENITLIRHCEELLGDVATQGCGAVRAVPLGCFVAKTLLATTK